MIGGSEICVALDHYVRGTSTYGPTLFAVTTLWQHMLISNNCFSPGSRGSTSDNKTNSPVTHGYGTDSDPPTHQRYHIEAPHSNSQRPGKQRARHKQSLRVLPACQKISCDPLFRLRAVHEPTNWVVNTLEYQLANIMWNTFVMNYTNKKETICAEEIPWNGALDAFAKFTQRLSRVDYFPHDNVSPRID